MTQTNTTQNKEELEQEIENRLQMIPSSYDRRKFRGLIQRIRTADKKKYDKSILLAHQSGIEEGKKEEHIKTLEWVLIQTGRWTNKSQIEVIQLSSDPMDRVIADEIVKSLKENNEKASN